MIDFCCIQRGMTIIPHRATSDPCEHLFSRMREMSGNGTTVTTEQANQALAKENLLNSIKLPHNGSYAHAPRLYGTDNVEKIDTSRKSAW